MAHASGAKKGAPRGTLTRFVEEAYETFEAETGGIPASGLFRVPNHIEITETRRSGADAPLAPTKENLRCYAEFHGVGVKGSKVEEILPYAWVALSHAKKYADVFVALGVKPKDVEAVCEASADMIFHVEWAQGYMTGIDPLSRPFHIVVCELAASLGAVDAALQRHLDEFGETSDLGRAVWRLKFRAYGYMWSLAGEFRDHIERVISFKTIHDPAEVARASAVVVPPEISNPPATPPVPPFPEHLHTWATAEMLNGYPHLHRILYGYEATAIKLGLVIKEQKILTGVVPDGSLKQGASLAQAAAISLYNAAAVTGDHLGGPMPISPALLSGGVAATFLTTINAIPPERVPEMRFFTAVASARYNLDTFLKWLDPLISAIAKTESAPPQALARARAARCAIGSYIEHLKTAEALMVMKVEFMRAKAP